jgi:hypothetical protein
LGITGADERAGHPTKRARILIALALAVFAAAISWFATHRPGFGIPDFHWWWLGARALLDGNDPYVVVPREIGSQFRLFHPLPALAISIPLALLRPDVALSTFSAVTTGILAWAVTRDSYDKLPLFLSASFAHAAVMGQWSMILTAAMVLPWLGVVGAAKPNVGLAILATTLSWRNAIAMLVFALLTLLLMPDWPSKWLAGLASSPYHFSPLRAPGGFLTVLALLRWRRPEARLLAVMGAVPQSPFVYEALPLFLIPRSRFETYALVIGSDLALGVYALVRGMETASFFRATGTGVVLCMYLPALALVLRRPNEGVMPAWVERASAFLPRWLRGAANASRC